jgi:hypothetical protein
MARIIVAFETEKEAQEAITTLMRADFGEVRARVLESTEDLSHPVDDTTAPTITPNLGTVEVRPSETPKMPDSIRNRTEDEASASVPTTGSGGQGVQVLIEVDDENEAEVRRILRESA